MGHVTQVCFGDDFWAVIQYVLLGEYVRLEMRFKYISMAQNEAKVARRIVYALEYIEAQPKKLSVWSDARQMRVPDLKIVYKVDISMYSNIKLTV